MLHFRQFVVIAVFVTGTLQVSALGRVPTGSKAPTADARHVGHAGCPLAAAGAPGAVRGELPQLVGQDAFAALAEMSSLLVSDPDTDWSKVDLDALRTHLVDMNRVMLDAEVRIRQIEGGFEALIVGRGRTREAIQRMVPAHARAMDGRDGLKVTVDVLGSSDPDGARLTVTTTDGTEVAKLRGLGFSGFMASGDHHLVHHQMMAAGGAHP